MRTTSRMRIVSIAKRAIQGTFVAGLFIILQASPAQATIDKIFGPPGELCALGCAKSFDYPVRQGKTTIITVNGQFVDLSTGLEVSGSGVTVSSAAGTTSSNKKISVAVSADAAPGVRTIKLHYAVEVNGPDTFQVLVVRSGVVASVSVPSPSEFFNDVDVTLHGQKLDNAGVFVLPNTVGTLFIGGGQVPQGPITLTQTDATATILTQSATAPVVRVHFIGGPFAEAKATLILYDKQLDEDTCKLHRGFCYGGIDNGNGESTFHVIGPNAVSSVTFPLGSSVRVGSNFTIKITLVRPAKAAPIKAPTSVFRTTASGGEVVSWQVVPSDSFEEAAGSGTRFSPTGDNPRGENTVTIPAGDQSIILTIRLKQTPSSCPQSGCSAQVRTRTGNFNTDQPPFLRITSFTMVPAVQ
jgi:hypothetical protein